MDMKDEPYKATKICHAIYNFPMMKKRETWLLGHGWNKFHDNDTFMIDTFSVSRTDGVTQIIYGDRETIIQDLRNFDNFKQALSLFASDKQAKILAREDRFKHVKQLKKKIKSKDELKKVVDSFAPVKEVNTVDPRDF